MMAVTVAQLGEICGAQKIEGDRDRIITGANALENASEEELSFVAHQKALDSASHSRAGCLLVPLDFGKTGPWSLLRVPDPRAAFARALSVLYPAHKHISFRHPTAIVAPSAEIAENVYIGPFVTVGEGTRIGPGSYLGDGCAIGDSVSLGSSTILRANVTIYNHVQIGSRVLLHAGCVIGADGFGFALAGDHYEKFPQVGTVVIEDDVEIGANSCVDRAALGRTRIGRGTKLDNLVHVAHNCDIGCHVVVAAQSGFSGGVVVGDYAVIGGQVGVADKARIEAKAIVGAQSGIVTSQRVPAGEPVWGTPARPIHQHLRGLANVGKLTEMRNELKQLKQQLQALQSKLESVPGGSWPPP
ncbi:MAG: UDP-3-O-(3-hydroxymyristoyl)glucosamine N-acyltransferase [Acidobacteriaceae bacterium]|nr:UDP-3-O-(3-hydroxymyristoyl)glucosamine N-acyltransferase [Acidobacteriaceae bacterium]